MLKWCEKGQIKGIRWRQCSIILYNYVTCFHYPNWVCHIYLNIWSKFSHFSIYSLFFHIVRILVALIIDYNCTKKMSYLILWGLEHGYEFVWLYMLHVETNEYAPNSPTATEFSIVITQFLNQLVDVDEFSYLCYCCRLSNWRNNTKPEYLF